MMVKAVDYLEEDPVLTAVKQPRSANRAWQRFRRHRLAMFGVFMIVLLVLATAVGPHLIPFDDLFIDIRNRFAPPLTGAHVLGTDPLWRDLGQHGDVVRA